METKFHTDTPQAVQGVLEAARINRTRIRLFYGDADTGRDWQEQHDMVGYVGRSCGPASKIPLLVYNRRSLGGGGILDHCIVRIETSIGRRLLYSHPKYHRMD